MSIDLKIKDIQAEKLLICVDFLSVSQSPCLVRFRRKTENNYCNERVDVNAGCDYRMILQDRKMENASELHLVFKYVNIFIYYSFMRVFYLDKL